MQPKHQRIENDTYIVHSLRHWPSCQCSINYRIGTSKNMTWGNPPKFKSDPPKRGKKITPEMLAASGSEDGEQAALFCWAADSVGTYPQLRWLFSVPNGGSRHIAEATKMVATGLRGGVPDVCLPTPVSKYWRSIKFTDNNMYHGCFIEMKVEKRRKEKDGGASEEQLEWIEYLIKAGYYVAVCYSWHEARDTLIKYLEGKV